MINPPFCHNPCRTSVYNTFHRVVRPKQAFHMEEQWCAHRQHESPPGHFICIHAPLGYVDWRRNRNTPHQVGIYHTSIGQSPTLYLLGWAQPLIQQHRTVSPTFQHGLVRTRLLFPLYYIRMRKQIGVAPFTTHRDIYMLQWEHKWDTRGTI